MTDDVARCASTSLHWYETIFRSHDLAWSLSGGLWSSVGTAPPYHSQALTRAPSSHDTQREGVRGLVRVLGRGFAVADTWHDLDLAPLGFRVLFEAEWLLLDGASPPAPGPGGPQWRRVASESDLRLWQDTWRCNGSPCEAPVFLPSLLADPQMAIFGAWRGDALVAGCVANRAPAAVGFSNFFSVPGQDEILAGAVAQALRFAGDLPLAAYDRGPMLVASKRAGFRAVGPFRVWCS